MRCVIKGVLDDAGTLKLFKAADDAAMAVRCMNDTGTVIDTTGDTLTLQLYSTVDRKTTAVAALALVEVDDALGLYSFTPAVANTGIAVGTYFVFLKRVAADLTVSFSTNYYKLTIG